MIRIERPWLSAAAISLYRYAWSLHRYTWRLVLFCGGGLVLGLAWYIPVRFPQWNTTVARVLAEHLLFVVVLSISLGGLLFWLLLWKLPQWQVSPVPEVKDRLDLESKARQTLAQILGGAAFLVGLYFTAQTLHTTQEGQITDRFTKAIDQLGKDTLAVRLGGIYALERIARDSDRDHWQVMEVLTAFVRKHPQEQPRTLWEWLSTYAPKRQEGQPRQISGPPSDLQAALTVIGRRIRRGKEEETQRLDLSRANLERVNLESANLERANLFGANLESAILESANLERAHLLGANLERANLEWANLNRANLEWANLNRAFLSGANLSGAPFFGANLSGANLSEANLSEANLSGAQHLTQAQINAACMNERTILPSGLANSGPCLPPSNP